MAKSGSRNYSQLHHEKDVAGVITLDQIYNCRSHFEQKNGCGAQKWAIC